MKTKDRFSVVEDENGKWKVLDAHERSFIWEGESQQEARTFADAKNRKEFLRTGRVVKIEPSCPNE